jgi:hypothetical protein
MAGCLDVLQVYLHSCYYTWIGSCLAQCVVLWAVTPCSTVDYQRFGRPHLNLHHRENLKYRMTSACLCFNSAPRHEGVLKGGGIALRILDLGTRWRWVVSFTPQPLYTKEGVPGTHSIGGWMGPRAGLDTVKRKIPNPCRDSNPRSSSP